MNEEIYFPSMRQWVCENGLIIEFDDEITNDTRFALWCTNESLVRRFGFFVLEHSMKEKDNGVRNEVNNGRNL